uniref:hypothetical protein n=1 Tax=Pseudofabraea citricarpa TaxID=1664388 RepID=UPI0022FD4E53
KHLVFFSITIILFILTVNSIKIESKANNAEYIKMFWVGLMDGYGSIQVNHRRMKSLQYRLVIKLSYLESNYNMLLNIARTIGGIVRIVNNKEVLWVVDKKETILSIINILSVYPPLTSRLTCQLEFLKVCLKNNSVKNYLNNRKLKYKNQLNIIEQFSKDNTMSSYFPSWLSGFIEAKGCFSIRINKNHSFSIEQNEDFYLLEKIRVFFNLSVRVRNLHKKKFFLETYKKETLNRIISHSTNYPLLGEKSQSLYKFIKVFQK